ncbi:MAG: B12-binding domain-containing radical SAM protein [Elusimicrobia bacterium]|nr:B12-binding domain-containing radical SAM protein [Elusimicrobiota bacterium]
MAKVLFLQNFWYESPAVMALSASLKRAGHETLLAAGDTIADFRDVLLKESPDIIGFSLMSGLHLWGVEISKQIRLLRLPRRPTIVYGGPHPTFFPDVLKKSPADAICVGEGDHAIVELADCIDQGKSTDCIRNLSVKLDGIIKANPIRPLARLDDLPPADREIYYRHEFFAQYPTKSFMTGRGCPFRCSFCYNATIQDLYRDKGSFVRFRPPAHIIEEIAQTLRRWKCRTVYFMDDTFGLKKSWCLDLLRLYRKEIHLPFMCKIRADTVDEEMVAAFREARCRTVQFAIETANEKLRTTILKKQITDADIAKTARLLNKYGIKFLTYNMVGLPGETLDDVFAAIKLNADLGTSYPWCSIFNPYPGTELAEYCIAQGHMDRRFDPDELDATFHKASVLKGRDYVRVANIHKLFGLGVFAPSSIPLIRGISRLKPNLFFTGIFLFINFMNYFRSEKLTLREAFMLGVRNAKLMIGAKRAAASAGG